MNDFESLLSTDYGFKPQGKSAPMAPQKPNNKSSLNSNFPQFNVDVGDSKSNASPNRKSPANDFPNLGGFSDVFSEGRSKSSNPTSVNSGNFLGGDSSLPVFDKPVYDDEGLSGGSKYADIFSSNSTKNDAFDDLLGGLPRKETQAGPGSGSKGPKKGSSGFDDLLPGFGRGAPLNRKTSDAAKKTSNVTSDPFVVLESTSSPAPSSSAVFNDPLEELGHHSNFDKRRVESTTSGGVFDDVDPIDGFRKSVPVFSADLSGRQKDDSPLKAGPRSFERKTSENGDVRKKSSKKMPVNDYREPPQNVFEMPSVSADSSPAYRSSGYRESHSYARSSVNFESSDDIWLTVSEVPLFTQPTAAPPPSRPPPPRPARFSKVESHSFPASNAQKKSSEYSSSTHFQSRKSEPAAVRGSFASPIDELENFATGRNHGDVDVSSAGEDHETNSVAAAAMKEAVAKAEARFRQAREAKDRENARASRSREAAQVEKEEKEAQDSQERRLEHERRQREKDEEERRRIERVREEKEREKRRIERERELARQAIDRAAREARERAAAEARARAERAAVQKVQAEARGRAERAAVQRVQAEARDRAAAEAKERAEKAAAEARERARVEKEARERAARTNQQKNENDLESFFGAGPRASSAPRPRASSSDSTTANFQNKPAAETTRTSVNSSSNLRKASSSTNIVDDLSSIFGGPPSSGGFQEVEGESEERRRARLERHQRTQERAAKALAEKNARDLEVQREQAERHRIGETMDIEIKRWAAGKEGNLRALLSTLQYVLWPECGWQPVSLTDLITGAAVKKVYRKATLCIHPDKVQQKGANLQQKYIAEKVFDILKEAWNKFNSEELF